MEYITVEGLNKLKKELDYLTCEKREELKEQLKYATSLGDLRENSEYDAVVEDFINTENKILELEIKINTSKIYRRKNIDKVEITSIVKLEIDGDIEEYQIVGSNEFDLDTNKISYKSVLGKTLLGKKVDDVVKIETDNYSYEARILEII